MITVYKQPHAEFEQNYHRKMHHTLDVRPKTACAGKFSRGFIISF